MKTKRGYFKKTLSLILSLLLVVGTFCFFNPFTATEADAATAGSYKWKVTLYVEDDYDWKHDAMNVMVDYYTKNGYGSNYQNDGSSYFYVWKNQYENDNANYSFEGTSKGFPTRVRLSAMKNNNKLWNANYRCILYVYNYNNNSWVEIANSGKVTGIGKKSYLKNLDVGNCSSSNSNWPKVNSVTIGGSDMTATVPTPGAGNVTKTTSSTTVYDQYGVEWYQEADSFFVTDSATKTSGTSMTGISCTTSSGDKSTVTITNAAKDWVANNGSNSSRAVYVRAKKGDVYSNARKITITNYKVSAKYYNYSESTQKWDDLLQEKSYYYYFTTKSPAVSRTNWEFAGWSTDKEASSGKISIEEPLIENTTWYALWKKPVTANFYYYDANGVSLTHVDQRTFTTKETTFTATPPAASSTITYDGRTFKFLGWRTDKNPDVANSSASDFVFTNETAPNTVRNFYAVYSSDINFRFDGNGGTVSGNTVKTQTQYLNASGNKTSHTFDLSGASATINNATYVGWGETSDTLFTDATLEKTFTVTSDKTVYAVYKCEVKFYNDDVLFNSQTVTRNYPATDPSPLPDTAPDKRPQRAFDDDNEFYFKGWDKNFSKITENTTVKAEYEVVAHTYVEINTTEYPAIAPTCTTGGQQSYQCNHLRNDNGEYCHHIKTVKLGANGHTLVTKPGKAPTCTTPGYTDEVSCSFCGFVEKERVDLPANGHTWGDYTDTESDCKTNGVHVRTCEVCGAEDLATKVVKPIDSTKHNPITIAAKSATCTENGMTEYTICSVCKAVLTPPEVIITEGHDWIVPDGEEAVEATCTTAGRTARIVCGKCDAVKQESEVIPATGHHYVSVAAKEPTCTEAGNYSGYRCAYCGEWSGGDKTRPALGHDYEDLTVVKEATCSEEGLKVGGCKRCGKDHVEEIIPKLAHTPEKIDAIEATCSSYGYTEGEKCAVCGEITVAPKKVKMLDHTWKKVSDGTAATCAQAGVSASYECSVCGAKKGGNVIPKIEHSYGEVYVTKKATCGVAGEKVVRCGNCGDTKTEIIPALTHSYVVVDAVSATCTTDGHTAGVKCENCGEWSTEPTVIPATGHSFGEEITEPATCSADGRIYRVCSACGEEETVETLEKLGHTEEVIPAVAATCTRVGKTEGKKCSVCGEILVKPENVEPIDHVSVVDVEATDATCAHGGNTEGTKCAVCGKILVKARNLSATEHKLSAWTVVTKATCTSQGVKERHCTVEGCTYSEREFTPAFGHSYGDWVTVVEPSCDGEGTKRCVCTRCGDVIDQVISANGHSKVAVAEVPATCETDGIGAGVECSVCGVKFEGFDVIPALGHDYEVTHVDGDCEHDSYDLYVCKRDKSHTYINNTVAAPGHTGGIATCTQKAVCDVCGKEYGELAPHSYESVVIAPTCKDSGYTLYTCTVCGDEYRGELVPATGEHDFTDGIISKAATCTEAGSKTITCKDCGFSLSVEIPAKGHSVSEWTVNGNEATGTCSECGETVTRPATSEDVKECERCGYHHTRTTGLFKYKGVFCSITYFFRQIVKFFKGGK